MEDGRELSTSDDDGMTSLHFASKNGNKDVVILLLREGGDLAVETVTGKTPVSLALENGHGEIFDV